MLLFLDCKLYDIQIAAFISLAPIFTFLGGRFVMIFHPALAAGVNYLLILIDCFSHKYILN